MNTFNIIMIIALLIGAGIIIALRLKKKQDEKVEAQVQIDDKTYTLDKITAFVKRRLDEITKINLYDIGLSEEELQRNREEAEKAEEARKAEEAKAAAEAAEAPAEETAEA